MIGDGNVGKTSLCNVYTGKGFSEEVQITNGIDYIRTTKSPTMNPEENVKLLLWDTAGQERYRCLAKTFYQKA